MLYGFIFLSALAWAEESKEEPKEKTIAELTEKHEVSEGLFTVYQDSKTGKIKMAIKKSQLNKEYIYFAYTHNGVLDAWHFRGAYRSNRIVSLKKHFNKIEFSFENTSYYFDDTSALSKAADANISPSLFASVEIQATEKTETDEVYLIDAQSILVSEALHQIKPSANPEFSGWSFNLGSLKQDRSKIKQVRNYDKNTDFVIDYVYNNSSPYNSGSSAVTDARNVTITMQHSLIELPESDYQSRFDDFRVGYFFERVTDLTSTEHAPYRDLITRWKLVKKNPNAELSEPIEPITWWMENTTPVEYRETVKEGVLLWNKAFEKAGFKNAIVVKQQPDDATWDAGDIQYNVLRWTSSPQPPFGGYGPSFTNPRTGEIIGADIMLEFVYMTNRLKYQELLQRPSQSHTVDTCQFGSQMQHEMMLGKAALEASNSSTEEMGRLFKEGLKHLVLHEVGHTLGLSHNMKASSMVSPEDLHNMELAEQRGLVGSVMDYTPLNLAPKDQPQGKYYIDMPGPYDVWAIQFGYTPSLTDENAEATRVKELLARSADPLLTFGNDADDMRYPGKGLDPRVLITDLSSDGIGWAAQRFDIIDDLSVDLKQKYEKPGKSWQGLVNAFSILMSKKYGAAVTTSRFIGGVYVERGVTEQFNKNRMPFTPVAEQDQKRAMNVLAKKFFAPEAFDAPAELLQHLQAQRRGFMFFSTSEDPKIHQWVLNFHQGILAHLLHPTVLQRLTDTQRYGNTYTVNQMISDLTEAIFAADLYGSLNGFRQNLQVEYTQNLLSMLDNPMYDHISQAAALDNIRQIKKLVRPKYFGLCCGDEQSRAHRNYIASLVKYR